MILRIVGVLNNCIENIHYKPHDKENKAILLLHADDIDNLISVLTENDITIVPSEEVYNL